MVNETPEAENTDVNIEAGSSPEHTDVNLDADTSAASPVDVTESESSADNDVKEEKAPKMSIAERISEGLRKLSGEDKAAEESSTKEKTTETKPESSEQEPKAEEKQDEEQSAEEKSADANWHQHPATKKVLAERKAARAERDDLQAQLENLQPQAERYEKLEGFLKQNNVSNEDAAEALQLTALAYQNPQEFYKRIVKMANEWGTHLGEILPEDLQKEVNAGYITEKRAHELARSRGQQSIAEGKAQLAAEQSQRLTQEQAQSQEMEQRAQLFNKWHEQTLSTDPSLEKKMPLITDRLYQILAKEGDPKDANDAWERLNRAHKEVSDALQGFQPKPKPMKASPQSTGTPGAHNAEPQSFEEAMQLGIARLSTGG